MTSYLYCLYTLSCHSMCTVCHSSFINLCLLYVVPLSTYVMGPTSKDHMSYYGDLDGDGGELIDDITFLGKLQEE